MLNQNLLELLYVYIVIYFVVINFGVILSVVMVIIILILNPYILITQCGTYFHTCLVSQNNTATIITV